jgi:hypothetical protein
MEITVVTDFVERNHEVMTCKFNSAVDNNAKNELWAELTAQVNALGVHLRTTFEVKQKWKNLHVQAKEAYTQQSTERGKTGGGPAPKEVDQRLVPIIALYEDCPSFNGITGGLETSIDGNKHH